MNERVANPDVTVVLARSDPVGVAVSLAEATETIEVDAVVGLGNVDLSTRPDCLVIGAGVEEGAALALDRAFDGRVPLVVTDSVEADSLRSVSTVVDSLRDTERLVRAVERAVASDHSGDDDAPVAGFGLDSGASIADLSGAFSTDTGPADPLDLVAEREKLRAAIGRCLGDGSASVVSRVDLPEGAARCEIRLCCLYDDIGRPVRVYGTVHERHDRCVCTGPRLVAT